MENEELKNEVLENEGKEVSALATVQVNHQTQKQKCSQI